ncbi:hypothetical protein NRB20_58330 [Nocardia sp. RB20]|uniref:Uncharacterized protein n=1 Tax=Nocardia macrotermitis TaxID=2585198 RepID=A0A7K0DB15_9NOCA|nr:hypothetical protein [Nocardia macrotermitis]
MSQQRRLERFAFRAHQDGAAPGDGDQVPDAGGDDRVGRGRAEPVFVQGLFAGDNRCVRG